VDLKNTLAVLEMQAKNLSGEKIGEL